MVKMIVVLLFGIGMFCAAAGGSWYVQNRVLTPPVAAKPAKPEAAAPHDPAAPPRDAAATTSTAGGDRLPVAVRPREMSVEELLRYSMGVKEREEKVKQSEELLQKRRMQQQLALADIEGERREIDDMRTQVSDQLKMAQTMIERLNDIRSEFLQEKESASQSLQQMKHERITIDDEHQDNTKRLSQWIQSMPPEKAAQILSSMANDGEEQMKIAVQILRNLEEREAAKILSAVEDTKLVQQLIQNFRNLQKPPVKTANRR